MKTIKITKKDAKFIKETATKEINTGKNFERTFYLPVFYALTDVMIDCNGVSGVHSQNGETTYFDVEFSDEAEEILDIY